MPAPPDQRPSRGERPPPPPLRSRSTRPVPGGRPPRDRARDRVLAFVGVGALLLAFVLMIAWITGGGGDDSGSGPAQPQAAQPTPQPTATPKPKPTAVALTPDEKAERQAAVDVLTSRQFEPVKLSDWDPQDTLRVLVGRRSDGGRLAFFFVNGDYVGNDTSEVSGSLKVKKTQDLTTTLRYGTFVAGDQPGKPTGDPVDVSFTWDGTALSPDIAVPPLEQRRAITAPG